MRILLVEDEEALARAVIEHLEAEAQVVDWFASLEDAVSAARAVAYDMILLDLQLPDGDGLDLLTHLRGRAHRACVIIMTARDKISDRIKGLNAGADDYVIKPFDLDELSARINTVSRRLLADASQLIQVRDLEFDLFEHRSRRAGVDIALTAKEWSLMECLLRRKSGIVPKAVLEEALYAFGKEIESNSIEAHVSRLRAKLGKDVIVTHRGLGYGLAR